MKMRGADVTILKEVVKKLASDEAWSIKNNAHRLSGSYSDYYKCHIKPDWLLIYKIENEILTLILTRTGTHSDLFK